MKVRIAILSLLLAGFLAPAAARAQYSSVCMRNAEKIEKVMGASSYKNNSPGYRETEFREMKVLAVQMLQPCAGTDERAKRLSEQTTEAIQQFDADCSNPNLIYQDEYCRPTAEARFKFVTPRMPFGGGGVSYEPMHSKQEIEAAARYMALFRSEVAKALSDPNYSADLGPIKGGAASASKATSLPTATADDPLCPGKNLEIVNEKIATIDEELARYNRQVPENSTAMTPALQAVMWGTSEEAKIIKIGCQTPAFKARLESLNASYQAALQACRQISSFPDTDCVPVLPDNTAFERQLTETPAPQTSSPSGNTSTPAAPAKGAATSSESSCANTPGRGVCVAR